MTEHIDDIKKELEEVRRLKEELRREVEDAKRQKEEMRRERSDDDREREEARRHYYEMGTSRPPKSPKPPREPRHVPPVKIDIAGITDSLEDMMEDLGHSIETSIKDLDGITEGFKIPGVHIRTRGHRGKADRRKEIEAITPERIAKIVAPLGSEERLGILDYLKTGGKSFNDIEIFTGKTGSSLTHHLNPLVEAGYVVKGEVRGTYYVTVEGRLAYRLAQWLTHRVEKQREQTGNNGGSGESKVDVEFDETSEDDGDIIVLENEDDVEAAADHLDRVADEIDRAKDKIEDVTDIIDEARDAQDEAEEAEDEDDLDDLDWKD
ncbi:MAG: hypothetical protein C4K48_03500 [Candidatus Thorarchaeota archaeon]|nr:MAG: hypothetical protein C4K48_03500 [Candidatus Thorarchaeota archaeon]